MNKLYDNCLICPKQCQVNRTNYQLGSCQAPPYPKIAKIMLHTWEEPCISGTKGSGAIFFSHCNLKCLFCQNYTISHNGAGTKITVRQLAENFLSLQEQGAHNINLVSPTPYIPSIAQALVIAKNDGLSIPIVYNTNAYELPKTLNHLNGLVDIYLPDLKYYYPETSQELAGVSDYFQQATASILRMFEQVGPTQLDSSGLMTRGLLIRHLILPGYLDDSKHILEWINSNLPKSIYISLMSQYFPAYRGKTHPRINRSLSAEEYQQIVDYFLDLGLENGFAQDISSANEAYVPDFGTNNN